MWKNHSIWTQPWGSFTLSDIGSIFITFFLIEKTLRILLNGFIHISVLYVHGFFFIHRSPWVEFKNTLCFCVAHVSIFLPFFFLRILAKFPKLQKIIIKKTKQMRINYKKYVTKYRKKLDTIWKKKKKTIKKSVLGICITYTYLILQTCE